MVIDLASSALVIPFDFVSDVSGVGAAPFPIPNDPALVGGVFYVQTLWLWSDCNTPSPFHLSSSAGLQLTVLP